MANFNFPFIPENHRFALARYIERNKSVLLEHLIAKLYRSCLEYFYDENSKVKKHVLDPEIIYARGSGGGISICTDRASGIFIQFKGQLSDNAQQLQLTAGQKWVVEEKGLDGNLVTTVFSAVP